MKRLLAALVVSAFTLQLSAADRSLVIDKTQSRIEFDVQSTLHDFTGKLPAYEIDILADPASSAITKAQLQFRIRDLRTGDEKRDRDLLKWENEDRFPAVIFTLEKIDSAGTKANAHGHLLLHGTSKPLSFPVTIASEDKKSFSIEGDTTLDTREFGLPIYRKYGLLRVDPFVKVRFHLQGKLQSE
jgi:polyisoprenoid-binding protein YceI